MSLRIRFLLIFSCFIFVMLAVASGTYYVLERHAIIQSQRQQSLSTLESVASICQEASQKKDWPNAVNLIKALVKDISVYSATCIDGRGRVVVDADPRHLRLSLSAAEMNAVRNRFFETEYTNQEGRIFWQISRPVWIDSRPVGVARVEFSARYLRRQLQHRLLETLRRMSFVCVITMVFALLAAFIVSRNIVRPLEELKSGAQKVGGGQFLHRIASSRKDELGELANEFDAMAAKLNELEELKDNFLARITHDLRNPLAAMLGHAEIMIIRATEKPETGNPETEQSLHQLKVIRSSGLFLAELINNILDLTKLEAGRMDFFKTAVALRPMAESVIELMQVKALDYKLELDCFGIPSDAAVWADETALRRVMLNLVSNAMKFTPEKGKVSIAFSRNASGEDLIEVSDTGIGIPADKMGVLFTKFGQIQENQNKVRVAKGTGLGLVICKEIIGGHGGTIWAESAPGKGTTFRFTLPVNPAQEVSAPPIAPQGREVLVVDDDPENLSLVKCTLEGLGFQAHTAGDFETALKLLDEVKPSLVVTDIHLPGRTGYDLCQHIKGAVHLRQIPVIMMTGTFTRTESRLRAQSLGADAYLLKPFLVSELSQAIQRVTGRRIS